MGEQRTLTINSICNLTKKSRPNKSSRARSLSIRAILRNSLLFFVSASIIVVMLLRFLPVPTTAFMLFRHYEDLIDEHSFKPIQYQWVSAKKISPNASSAVIASEDQHFYQHFGFDLQAIRSSINTYITGGRRLRGASTITQQVAKNLFLTPSKSFVRKGLEAWFTLLIEIFWSKERILTVYLNIAEFGNHLFGIEAASQHYFGVSAKSLSRSQAAMLAATLPNPLRLLAARPSSYVVRRQNWILRQMRNIGDPARD
ncbi:MAG: monofunctional biosynthetic peptidoglycan transglycosylase [Methylococcales bacterium]|nr:monofunctional biosynthetic peptidoglycan transglycosylase [Methylococcales bacterium]